MDGGFIDMRTLVDRRKAQFMAATAACCLFAALPLRAQVPFLPAQPLTEQKPPELEPIIVYGGLATPKMWKVSKGDHVLWVLGDAPAPAGATWRFDQVEARLAESQLLMYPGKMDVDVGFFKVFGMVTLVPSAYKAVTKNPDNKTLKDVLPPDVYGRWRVLKAEYAPRDNDLERFRPSFALQKLEQEIGEKLGPLPEHKDEPAQPRPPPRGPALRPLVDKAAKQHKVKVRTLPKVELKVEIKNTRGILKFIRESDLVDEMCVTQKLEYLERRIEYIKQNAGTSEAKPPARVKDCDEADEAELLLSKVQKGEIADPAGIRKMMDTIGKQVISVNQQLDAEWIAAAEAALAANKSTLAVLQIGWNGDVSHVNGYIAKLRELGYEVEEPGSVVN